MLVSEGQGQVKLLVRMDYTNPQNSTATVVLESKSQCHIYVTVQKKLISKIFTGIKTLICNRMAAQNV